MQTTSAFNISHPPLLHLSHPLAATGTRDRSSHTPTGLAVTAGVTVMNAAWLQRLQPPDLMRNARVATQQCGLASERVCEMERGMGTLRALVVCMCTIAGCQ
jgi:hypothetical protein